MAKTKEDMQREAVSIVKREKTDWEMATAFVTEKVAFQMRNLIRQLRKNFYGVFDEPIDTTTGRKKIWIPLTEWIVESVVKNIDLDTKDITFRAKRKEAIGFTHLVRSIVKNNLEAIGFGEKLDEFERSLAIDGTAVWATENIDGKLYTQIVDLLNFYIDPNAHSISETGSVIERIVLSKPDFDALGKENQWINIDEATGFKNVSRIDGEAGFQAVDTSGNTNYIELFRRRGWMPKYLMTGTDTDTDMIPGEIITSNNGGNWILHDITKRKDNKNKGYEEAWYTRVPNRWYGRGAAEKVMMLQLWINTTNNIRINRGLVSQLGLFKIRQGSGITPQMISRLGTNGAILVQNMGDIEQLAMEEAGASSYKDEEAATNWTRMVTSAFESVTGEELPSTTTATSAAISGRAAASSFTLIKEGVGMFLQRWLKNQSLPIIMDNTKRGDIIRYYPDSLPEYDEQLVNQIIYPQLMAIHQSMLPISPQQVMMEQQRAIAQLRSMGDERLIKLTDDIDVTEYDIEIDITNEEFDKGVLVQNLLTALQAVPEYRQPILDELFDAMGLPPFKAPQQMPQMPGQPGQPGQPNPTAPGQQNPQEQMTQANTGEAFGKAQALTNFSAS